MKLLNTTYNSSCGLFCIAFLSLLAFSSCEEESVEQPVVDPQAEEELAQTVEVPLTVSLGAEWEVDIDETRAAPPGVGGGNGSSAADETISADDGLEEIKAVDEVQIFTFRRRTDDSRPAVTTLTEEDYKTFEYDASNHYFLKESTEEEGELDDKFGESDTHNKKNHKVFRGSLKKVYGWEYKVIALAYSETLKSQYINGVFAPQFNMKDGDKNRFQADFEHDYDGDKKITLNDFRAVMNPVVQSTNELSWNHYCGIGKLSPDNVMIKDYAIEVPQLFYGDCFTLTNNGKSGIIAFSETDEEGVVQTNLPLYGLLYRGVAEIEIIIDKLTPHRETETALSHDRIVEWIGLMAENVNDEVGLRNYDDFLPISKTLLQNRLSNDGIKNARFTTIGYLGVPSTDPINKPHSLRTYILPCKTKLALRVYNYLHYLSADYYNYRTRWIKHNEGGDQDWNTINGTGIISPDYNQGEFYFRRNHKYVIHIADIEQFMNNAPKL